MALRLTSRYQTQIVIDGEVIPISIKRLDATEAVAFQRDFQRIGRAATRPSGGADLPDEVLDAQVARGEQDEEAAKRFVVEALSAYVRVEGDHVFDVDQNAYVTQGADLVRLFGARQEVLSELLFQIFTENTFNAEQKLQQRTRLAPFVATPPAVADRMMALAAVGPDDVVVDLGCGNGRICVAAATRGARVFGYDLDADRIQEARAAATEAGVADRCTFEQKDALTVDLRQATVVSLYLLAAANAKLRPILLQQLPRGARVVSHAFVMGGDWIAESSEFVPVAEGETDGIAHAGARWVYLYSVDRGRRAHPMALAG